MESENKAKNEAAAATAGNEVSELKLNNSNIQKMKSRPSSGNVDVGAFRGYSTATGQFEKRLRAKAAQGETNSSEVKPSSSRENVGYAQRQVAAEQYEQQLKAKVAGGATDEDNAAGTIIGSSVAVAESTFEERLRDKIMESQEKPCRATVATHELINHEISKSKPTTFEERLKKKMDEGGKQTTAVTAGEEVDSNHDARNQEPRPGMQSEGNFHGNVPIILDDLQSSYSSEHFQENSLDCTNDEEIVEGLPNINSYGPEEQATTQPADGSEDAIDSMSPISLDDVFMDMQRFKQENGSLRFPPSHPTLLQLRNALSPREVEPLVQEYVRSESQPVLQEQDARRSVSQGRRSHSLGSILNHFNTNMTLPYMVSNASNPGVFLQAMLVEDEDEAEVVMAQPVSFIERKWKPFAAALCAFSIMLVLLVSLTLTKVVDIGGDDTVESYDDYQPTLSPTSSPTFDPRPTLEIIQSRGYIRCGISNAVVSESLTDLCRSVAAVVVGNPDGMRKVPVIPSTRWRNLKERNFDILINGDTHTIEREVRESSTGSGFTFSTPYYYDGVVFSGNETFVRCAEDQKRYDECAPLMICVHNGTSHFVLLKKSFPSDNYIVTSSSDEMASLFLNNTCNVMAFEKSSALVILQLNNNKRFRNMYVGGKLMTKEPLAIVTRNDDNEFSDVINWVVQALIFGEEQGLVKDMSLCQNYSDLALHGVPDLDFLHAVYCVGNYGEIFGGIPYRGMNRLNRGNSGMFYAIPFGNLDRDTKTESDSIRDLARIKNEGLIKCGVAVPDNFVGDITISKNLVGMGVEYCRALAAALFLGDFDAVNFLTFPETNNSSLYALANGTIDVLVGERIQQKYVFEMSPSLPGFQFSTPYYYGNDETARNNSSFYSIATRQDDPLLSSFVNCIVLATIYALENDIDYKNGRDMPLVSLFGADLSWALRDSITYSGNWESIYTKNFGSQVSKADRGRNTLNEGGPLQLSLPGLNAE